MLKVLSGRLARARFSHSQGCNSMGEDKLGDHLFSRLRPLLADTGVCSESKAVRWRWFVGRQDRITRTCGVSHCTLRTPCLERTARTAPDAPNKCDSKCRISPHFRYKRSSKSTQSHFLAWIPRGWILVVCVWQHAGDPVVLYGPSLRLPVRCRQFGVASSVLPVRLWAPRRSLLRWADVWACPSRVNLRLSDGWQVGECQLNEGSDFRNIRKKL